MAMAATVVRATSPNSWTVFDAPRGPSGRGPPPGPSAPRALRRPSPGFAPAHGAFGQFFWRVPSRRRASPGLTLLARGKRSYGSEASSTIISARHPDALRRPAGRGGLRRRRGRRGLRGRDGRGHPRRIRRAQERIGDGRGRDRPVRARLRIRGGPGLLRRVQRRAPPPPQAPPPRRRRARHLADHRADDAHRLGLPAVAVAPLVHPRGGADAAGRAARAQPRRGQGPGRGRAPVHPLLGRRARPGPAAVGARLPTLRRHGARHRGSARIARRPRHGHRRAL